MPTIAPIPLHHLTGHGQRLKRPECVLCTADGSLYVSDWDGGVCQIQADGSQLRRLALNPPVALKPNGIALQADGSFLVANLGDDGGVWRLAKDGSTTPFVTEVEGVVLPPTNFIVTDDQHRSWITVSTRTEPRALAYRTDVRDGFVVLSDRRGTRIVADDLGYTNEVQLHPSGDWLYANETFARRTSRFAVRSDGFLGARQTVCEYDTGTFPDGLCFDEAGGFWVVSLVSNRVIRVDADGTQTVVIEDVDDDHLSQVEAAFQAGRMGRAELDNIQSQVLQSVSSIAFGGPGRKTAYLGNLLGDRIMAFASPVAGVKPVHWGFNMG